MNQSPNHSFRYQLNITPYIMIAITILYKILFIIKEYIDFEISPILLLIVEVLVKSTVLYIFLDILTVIHLKTHYIQNLIFHYYYKKRTISIFLQYIALFLILNYCITSLLHIFFNSSATNCTCVPTIICILVLLGLIIPAAPADLITFSSTFV